MTALKDNKGDKNIPVNRREGTEITYHCAAPRTGSSRESKETSAKHSHARGNNNLIGQCHETLLRLRRGFTVRSLIAEYLKQAQ